MTENEIKKTVAILEVNKLLSHRQTEFVEAADIAIQALEEIQQYQSIGTIEDINKALNLGLKAQVELMNYQKIGTIDEFKALKEKRTAKSRRNVAGKYFCPECGRTAEMGYCKACGQNLY